MDSRICTLTDVVDFLKRYEIKRARIVVKHYLIQVFIPSSYTWWQTNLLNSVLADRGASYIDWELYATLKWYDNIFKKIKIEYDWREK